MNEIIINGLVFNDNPESVRDGNIMGGNYFLSSSLGCDEIPINTLKFRTRYPLNDTVDTYLTKLPYATRCKYTQNGQFVDYYRLVSCTRLSKFEYELEFQSEIGLLRNYTHYGNIYLQGNSVGVLIDDIMSVLPFDVQYEVADDIKNMVLYGWLPIAPAIDNLKQVLFACGGRIGRKEAILDSDKILYFSQFSPVSPKEIADNKVYQGGKVTFDTGVSNIEVTEHVYTDREIELEKVYEGEIVNQTIITPLGTTTTGVLIEFKEPYHSLTCSGGTIIISHPNYCVVRATLSGANVLIQGIPYTHHTTTVRYQKNASGKTATIKDATLVSTANSLEVMNRSYACYRTADVLETASIDTNIISPRDNIIIKDGFDEVRTGYIKNVEGNFGPNIVRNEMEVLLNFSPYSAGATNVLASIEVVTPPNITIYAPNQYFDTTGMEVKAVFEDGTEEIITNYIYSPTEELKENVNQIVIYYTYQGVTKVTSLPIQVKVIPIQLEVLSLPNKMTYSVGEVFDPTGAVLYVTYNDGTQRTLSSDEYTWTPTEELTGENNIVTFEYVEGDITLDLEIPFSYGQDSELVSIAITENPHIMEYQKGDFFNPTGMIITGTFADGSTRIIKNYSYSPSGALEKGQDIITIQVNWFNGVFTTTLQISNYYLTGLSISNPPDIINYLEGENFDPTGTILVASYSNGKTRIVNDYEYTWTPETVVYTDSEALFTLTERGEVQTASTPITVDYYSYPYTKSKVFPNQENLAGTVYNIKGALKDLLPDATHRNIRVNYIGLPQAYAQPKISIGESGKGNTTLNLTTNNLVWKGPIEATYSLHDLISASSRVYGEDITETFTDEKTGESYTVDFECYQLPDFENNGGGKGGKHTEGHLGGPITSFDMVVPTEDSNITLFFDSMSPYGDMVDKTPQRQAYFEVAGKKGFKNQLDSTDYQETGFIDVFTQESYAHKGKDGVVDGADAGQGITGFSAGNKAPSGEIVGTYYVSGYQNGSVFSVTTSALSADSESGKRYLPEEWKGLTDAQILGKVMDWPEYVFKPDPDGDYDFLIYATSTEERPSEQYHYLDSGPRATGTPVSQFTGTYGSYPFSVYGTYKNDLSTVDFHTDWSKSSDNNIYPFGYFGDYHDAFDNYYWSKILNSPEPPILNETVYVYEVVIGFDTVYPSYVKKGCNYRIYVHEITRVNRNQAVIMKCLPHIIGGQGGGAGYQCNGQDAIGYNGGHGGATAYGDTVVAYGDGARGSEGGGGGGDAATLGLKFWISVGGNDSRYMYHYFPQYTYNIAINSESIALNNRGGSTIHSSRDINLCGRDAFIIYYS